MQQQGLLSAQLVLMRFWLPPIKPLPQLTTPVTLPQDQVLDIQEQELQTMEAASQLILRRQELGGVWVFQEYSIYVA